MEGKRDYLHLVFIALLSWGIVACQEPAGESTANTSSVAPETQTDRTATETNTTPTSSNQPSVFEQEDFFTSTFTDTGVDTDTQNNASNNSTDTETDTSTQNSNNNNNNNSNNVTGTEAIAQDPDLLRQAWEMMRENLPDDASLPDPSSETINPHSLQTIWEIAVVNVSLPELEINALLGCHEEEEEEEDGGLFGFVDDAIDSITDAAEGLLCSDIENIDNPDMPSTVYPDRIRAISGHAFVWGGEGERIAEGTVFVANRPTLQNITTLDGYFEFRNVAAEEKVSLTFSHPNYPPIQTATFEMSDDEVEEVTFEVPSFETLNALFPETNGCSILTTVTKAGVSLYNNRGVTEGESGAIVQIDPPLPDGHGPIYFDADHQPDPGLVVTSQSGRVQFTNVPEGIYTLSGEKGGVSFSEVEVDCTDGAIINASSPHGIQAQQSSSSPSNTISGHVFIFGKKGERLEGVTIRVMELPEFTTTTGVDGFFQLTDLPDGADVTLVMEKEDYLPMQTATFTIGLEEYKNVGFQASIPLVRDVLANFAEVIIEEGRCQLITTVTREGMSLYNNHRILEGHPGVIVSIDPPLPREHGPTYFNSMTIPDPRLGQTTVDGGVLFNNLPPGHYTLSGSHLESEFREVRITCPEGGALINAAPSWGIQEL